VEILYRVYRWLNFYDTKNNPASADTLCSQLSTFPNQISSSPGLRNLCLHLNPYCSFIHPNFSYSYRLYSVTVGGGWTASMVEGKIDEKYVPRPSFAARSLALFLFSHLPTDCRYCASQIYWPCSSGICFNCDWYTHEFLYKVASVLICVLS
jgi:hypothetical protein